jgi:hypothetical protein
VWIATYTDQIFYTRKIREKKSEYIGTVYHLFTNFEKAYDSVRRDILQHSRCILDAYKLFGPIKMCLNETYKKPAFHIQNGLKEGDALSPLPFNFAFEYVIRKV